MKYEDEKGGRTDRQTDRQRGEGNYDDIVREM